MSSADRFTLQIYDSKKQQFQTLKETPKKSNCRLRIILRKSSNDKQATTTTSQQQQQDETSQLLALPWKEFDVNLSDGSFVVNNKPLRIQEVTNTGQGTGLNVWDGSIVLTRYLEANAEEFVRNKTVLEVGAGTGLVGIAAAVMGARKVILTDLEYSIANMKENIRINQDSLQSVDGDDNSSKKRVEAKVLDWYQPKAFELWQTNESVTIDTILASDVVWIDTLVLPLVKTLEFICTRAISKGQAPPLILMSYQCRSSLTEELLLSTLKANSFEISHVPKGKVQSKRIQIFKISFRP